MDVLILFVLNVSTFAELTLMAWLLKTFAVKACIEVVLIWALSPIKDDTLVV
jgi:hypothetical protein